MRLSHTPARTTATFDDPNLVSHAGLIPLARLAENIDLPGLADELVRLGGPTGANPGAKITTTVLGMAAGADSITDLDLLRHGATPRLFTGIRAPRRSARSYAGSPSDTTPNWKNSPRPA